MNDEIFLVSFYYHKKSFEKNHERTLIWPIHEKAWIVIATWKFLCYSWIISGHQKWFKSNELQYKFYDALKNDVEMTEIACWHIKGRENTRYFDLLPILSYMTWLIFYLESTLFVQHIRKTAPFLFISIPTVGKKSKRILSMILKSE